MALPSTVEEIRAALPTDRLSQFDVQLAEFIGFWARETCARPGQSGGRTFNPLPEGT
ncbi:hypothetical protein ACFVIM_02505 [Streptomyces sp. NPDC057638]|uniref:hypothetical protein n=1 Tax=Streptomyces sp. NPDC057638 TaxID=3346190 RepID=UPI00368EC8A4